MSMFGTFFAKIKDAFNKADQYDTLRGLLTRNYWEPEEDYEEVWSWANAICREVTFKTLKRAGILRQRDKVVVFVFSKSIGRIVWEHAEPCENQKEEIRAIHRCIDKLKERVKWQDTP